MNLLDKMKDINVDSINKLKEMRYIHNCGVCNETINSNTDEDVMPLFPFRAAYNQKPNDPNDFKFSPPTDK